MSRQSYRATERSENDPHEVGVGVPTHPDPVAPCAGRSIWGGSIQWRRMRATGHKSDIPRGTLPRTRFDRYVPYLRPPLQNWHTICMCQWKEMQRG